LRICPKLAKGRQEATPTPPTHNTCTNILQLFTTVKIRGNKGLLRGEQKGGC
jgi:hypothetical protein